MGRQFDNWSGLAQNVGATTSKNMLGNLCLLACLYIVWEFLEKKSDKENSVRKIKLTNFPAILYSIMSFWLFSLAKSATSFVCFLIGATIFIISRTSFIRNNPNFIILILLSSFAGFIFLESIFGLSYEIIEFIGRDATLTGRIELWHDLLSFNINAVFGAGYDSFWLGERLKEMWENYWWKPTGAHNGYLETYLNLGSIGLIIIFVVIFSAFYKAKKNLSDKNKFGSFQLGIIVVCVLYNITESAFKGNILVWFVFLMVAIEHEGLRKLQYNEK
jgi:O-antigen ligase